MNSLTWCAEGATPELAAMLRELATEYPLREGAGGVRFVTEPGRSGWQRDSDRIHYGTLADAGRAVGVLLSGLDTPGEEPAFATLGVLLDCGHNATITSDHLRRWLRRLALLGYNMLQVYTEAGYALPPPAGARGNGCDGPRDRG